MMSSSVIGTIAGIFVVSALGFVYILMRDSKRDKRRQQESDDGKED